MSNSIFGHTNYLEKALDASWLRNQVVSNNIANIDTPNFKSSKVEFESTLKNAMEETSIEMKRTHADHLGAQGAKVSSFEPSVVKNTNTTARMDGNNVDIETEQVNLVKNVIYYNTLIQKMNKEFGRLRYAITEGK